MQADNTRQHYTQYPFLLMLWQLSLRYCTITVLPQNTEPQCLMPYG